MTDCFVPIPGFEGLYSITKYGDVRSDARVVPYKNGRDKRVPARILRPYRGTSGYLQINLTLDQKVHVCLIHRLIALTFISNPEGLPEVNHKDECKSNNNVDNLEWCTTKYNANYGTSIQRRMRTIRNKGKPVVQMTKDGSFIAEYPSIADACDAVKGNSAFISRCLYKKPRNPSAYGYIWRFKNEVA